MNHHFFKLFLCAALFNAASGDLETTSMLEKIVMKKLNIYACNDQLRSVILFSEQDMRSCKQLPQGSHYLCRGREILPLYS